MQIYLAKDKHLWYNKENYIQLIKSGGGTGPVKPGNLSWDKVLIPGDEMFYATSGGWPGSEAFLL